MPPSRRTATLEFAVRLRGLPFTATPADLGRFLDGVAISHEHMHFIINKEGRPSGEAYVELRTESDVKRVLSKHKEHMGPRYVETFRSSPVELSEILLQQDTLLSRMRERESGSPHTRPGTSPHQTPPRAPSIPSPSLTPSTHPSEAFICKLTGIPVSATPDEVIAFMRSKGVNCACRVHMLPPNSQSGECLLLLGSDADLSGVMVLNGMQVADKALDMTRVTYAEFAYLTGSPLSQPHSTPSPLLHGVSSPHFQHQSHPSPALQSSPNFHNQPSPTLLPCPAPRSPAFNSVVGGGRRSPRAAPSTPELTGTSPILGALLESQGRAGVTGSLAMLPPSAQPLSHASPKGGLRQYNADAPMRMSPALAPGHRGRSGSVDSLLGGGGSSAVRPYEMFGGLGPPAKVSGGSEGSALFDIAQSMGELVLEEPTQAELPPSSHTLNNFSDHSPKRSLLGSGASPGPGYVGSVSSSPIGAPWGHGSPLGSSPSSPGVWSYHGTTTSPLLDGVNGQWTGDVGLVGLALPPPLSPPHQPPSTPPFPGSAYPHSPQQRRAMAASVGGKGVGGGARVKLRGIPFTASPRDIEDFFDGFGIVRGSVKLGTNRDGRPSGEAWVEFVSVHEAQAAVQSRDKQHLGSRYIELFMQS